MSDRVNLSIADPEGWPRADSAQGRTNAGEGWPRADPTEDQPPLPEPNPTGETYEQAFERRQAAQFAEWAARHPEEAARFEQATAAHLERLNKPVPFQP